LLVQRVRVLVFLLPSLALIVLLLLLLSSLVLSGLVFCYTVVLPYLLSVCCLSFCLILSRPWLVPSYDIFCHDFCLDLCLLSSVLSVPYLLSLCLSSSCFWFLPFCLTQIMPPHPGIIEFNQSAWTIHNGRRPCCNGWLALILTLTLTLNQTPNPNLDSTLLLILRLTTNPKP
jgi:hypothetical protein